MRFICVLLLLLGTGLCDKNQKLPGTENDEININGRRKTSKDTARNEEAKYLLKTEVRSQSQLQQYHGPTAPPQEHGNQVGDYAELQSYGSFKYAQPQSHNYNQDTYQPGNTHNPITYDHHNSVLKNPRDQYQSEQQHYVQEGRSSPQNSYDLQQQHHHQQQQQQPQQQQLYQHDFFLKQQLPIVQQEPVVHKYTDKNENKDTYYTNLPTSQASLFYQNYVTTPSKNKNIEQQLPISIYMPVLDGKHTYNPISVPYQRDVQYISSFSKPTQVVYSKIPKTIRISPHTSAAATSTNIAPQSSSNNQQTSPVDVLNDEAYAITYQPHKYQFFVTQQQQQQQQQPQSQYVHQSGQQQLVYENADVYPDIYSTPSTSSIQDNTLFEHQQSQQQVRDSHNQHQQQQQQPQRQRYYVASSITGQYVSPLQHQDAIHNTADAVQQTIKETQEALHHDFTPPQYQAQRFRFNHEISHLSPEESGNEGLHAKSIYSSASELSQPKTLLDSYVPSHVIMAQDANRYRERPIKLESGFLPSKIKFVRSYKKHRFE